MIRKSKRSDRRGRNGRVHIRGQYKYQSERARRRTLAQPKKKVINTAWDIRARSILRSTPPRRGRRPRPRAPHAVRHHYLSIRPITRLCRSIHLMNATRLQTRMPLARIQTDESTFNLYTNKNYQSVVIMKEVWKISIYLRHFSSANVCSTL